MKEEIFKAYDIRGIYPGEINKNDAQRIGRAYADFVKPKKVIIGRDIRLSSRNLEEGLIDGLTEQGVDVYSVGEITTDMLFFAVGHYGFDGGIVASASHNPSGYGGFKVVREEAIPVTGNSGLEDIKNLAIKNNFIASNKKGQVFEKEIFEDYKKFVLSFIDLSDIKPQEVVFNTLSGAMGPVIEKVLKDLPIKITWVDKKPDPDFRKGEPNPLLPERRNETVEKIKGSSVDFGVSWDGDGDRCFFFDEKGDFIPAPFITYLIIDYLADTHPGLKVITDIRIVFPFKDIATKRNIDIKFCKAGRTFLQQELKKENAFLAAEMTAHYFFRDNYYSDNGIIPFLMILKNLSKTKKKLSELVKPLREKFYLIDEVKIETTDYSEIFKRLKEKYSDGEFNLMDGLTIEYPGWRFNLRPSNTEPVIRLNIEARSKELVDEKLRELKKEIIE